jgi:hypothetical protein
MKDISCHILDIVMNSLHADAAEVKVEIVEDTLSGKFMLKIRDNGHGMDGMALDKVTDPFFTTSLKKRVGLGIPLLKQNAELTGGTFRIESAKRKGTTVEAIFDRNHIDMLPLGDLAMTFRNLIAANPGIDFHYIHRVDDRFFELNTAVLRQELENVSLNTMEVLDFITDSIRYYLKALKK